MRKTEGAKNHIAFCHTIQPMSAKANDKCITSERNYLSEFSTHMVNFSHSHVCVKCRKRARNFFFFFGGGRGWVRADKSLLDCESMG